MSETRHRRREVESAAALQRHIDAGDDLGRHVIQGVDLTGITGLQGARLRGALLTGCRFADAQQEALVRARGGLAFPRFAELPYRPYRTALYSVDELMEGYDDGGYTGTLDFAIYAHAHRERHHPGGISAYESLAERIHDHAIDDALMEYLEAHRGRGVVGVMGGHGTPRSDPAFARVARVTWELTRRGYLVVTGGGPGVMEAGNLGAWFAGHDDPAVLERAIGELAVADTFDGGHEEGTPDYLEAIRAYLHAARQVVERHAGAGFRPGVSLAVPTWFYGHEPSNLFSSAVAKYFANSIREEGLLAIARAGVIYAPGSAGTMQEMFQDLCQNHYATYGWRSPMVLLGARRYAAEHELMRAFVARSGAGYGELLALLDDPLEVVRFIEQHPPREAARRTPLVELVQ